MSARQYGEAREWFKADPAQKIAEAASKGLRVFWIGESRFTAKTKL